MVLLTMKLHDNSSMDSKKDAESVVGTRPFLYS